MGHISRLFWSLVLIILAGSFTLHAQSGGGNLGLGVRAGFGLDPNQFVAGAQFSLGKKAGVARVVPSIDLGFGDNVTTIDFNADFLFRLLVEDTGFGFYGGGGPTVAFYDFKSGSSWEFGLSVVAGIELPIFSQNATNLEARLGIGDIPDFRLLFVVMF